VLAHVARRHLRVAVDVAAAEAQLNLPCPPDTLADVADDSLDE
jgi:hypothetical protein